MTIVSDSGEPTVSPAQSRSPLTRIQLFWETHRKEFFVGFIASTLSGLLVWYLTTQTPSPADIKIETLRGLPTWMLDIAGLVGASVVGINLGIVLMMIFIFCFVGIRARSLPFKSVSFMIWGVAWVASFLGIVLEGVKHDPASIYWDGLCGSLIMFGCFRFRKEHKKLRVVLILLPLACALIPEGSDSYWTSSFVNYFSYAFFAMVMLDHYRGTGTAKHAILIYNFFALYAALQLIYPVLLLAASNGSHVRVLGYGIGALVKLGGTATLLVSETALSKTNP